jgi:oxygen-independent coproporphyrinogen III oxidase
MVDAICKEIRMRLSAPNAPKNVETIYFGGGTPSLLHPAELEHIVRTLSDHVPIHQLLEFTLESNPDDINEERLTHWKSLGINRLSIGLQSFEDEDLKWMNRAHNASESVGAILLARKAGFDKLTVDLMYGLPNQDLKRWKKQLNTVLNLNIAHISSYCLTIEERTALKKRVEKGDLVIPDDELVAEQFDLLVSTLEDHGFEHYEISNFAKPNDHAIHNSNYWKGRPYIGIGPSAHGFNGEERYWNIANNTAYIKALEEQVLPHTIEKLTRENKFNELILTGLRTQWGVDFNTLNTLLPVNEAFENRLTKMQTDGLLEWVGTHFRLTKKAKLQADYLAAELFV